MRKKRIMIVLSTLLILILSLSACGSASTADNNIEASNKDTEVTVATVETTTTTTESATAETTEKEGKITENRNTEEVTTEVTTEVSATSASTTEVAQSTTESTASTVQATTHAATEAPATEHEHNWVIVTKTVEVPAETHTEVHYFRIDNGQEVPTNQVVGHQFADGIKECVQTGSYTVWECQCGFSGSPEEEAAHQREMQAGEDWWQHSQSFDHIEFTYAEVEQRTITVVDKEATTIQIPDGYRCTICGATKESD
ncbi:MAG: hypothetical protein IJ079_00865 [Lachnospiraceae bacterium]|nr:hypothetical protein [Lachnospiraceae bacterium]